MIQYQDQQLIVFESALFRTTTTLLCAKDFILLVDPTWLPHEVKEIKRYVDALKGGKSLYLLFTHSDYDHIIAASAFPHATVIASKAFVENEQKESILNQIRDFDDEYYIKREYEIAYPKVDIVISRDKQQLIWGDATITFYLAPGHNADGIFTIIEPYGIWIAGDYLSNIEFPYIYHSIRQYEETLSKVDGILECHAINILIPGHGDITTSKAEIVKRQWDALDYISNLKYAVMQGTPFKFSDLSSDKYQFPKIMNKFHQANIDLAQKELDIFCGAR